MDCKCQNRHSAISVLSFVLVGLKPKTLIETAIRRQMALGNKPQVWQLQSLVSYTNYKFGISGLVIAICYAIFKYICMLTHCAVCVNTVLCAAHQDTGDTDKDSENRQQMALDSEKSF